MKICLAWYPIDDPGGIINHNEQLAYGLRELGHDVSTNLFLPVPTLPRRRLPPARPATNSPTSMAFDQRRGYDWPTSQIIPYRGVARAKAVQFLNQFDLVIWQVAVPTKRKENRGNTDWEDLYADTTCKHLAVIHDGNFLDSYPWLCAVQEYLAGLICVHHCAYKSASQISVPSAWIPNPQNIVGLPDIGPATYARRTRGFLSLQTFKAWKHVPELVAAMPHAQGIRKCLAGKGIDYYYLTSKDKCKWPGIWDKALGSGMEYLDVITNEERDDILRNITCLVDPSWSRKYAAIGGHFNRVIVDAIMQGALPVVRPWGISDNEAGVGELFSGGLNCVTIPHGAQPVEYGQHLEYYANYPYKEYYKIMDNALNLLPLFARKTVAQQIIDQNWTQKGVTSERVEYLAGQAIGSFFYDKP